MTFDISHLPHWTFDAVEQGFWAPGTVVCAPDASLAHALRGQNQLDHVINEADFRA